jgi:hypothetical protein
MATIQERYFTSLMIFNLLELKSVKSNARFDFDEINRGRIIFYYEMYNFE